MGKENKNQAEIFKIWLKNNIFRQSFVYTEKYPKLIGGSFQNDV